MSWWRLPLKAGSWSRVPIFELQFGCSVTTSSSPEKMMLQIKYLAVSILAIGMVGKIAEANVLHRVRRQSDNGNGEIIDNIFNIPITAIRQTAAAAQSLYPDGGSSIDSVFNIPVATLEAVGNLVKSRNSFAQRRPMDGSSDIQKRRKERKDRLHAHRQQQRLQHKDPLGVNALTDLLVGHHGLFSGHGVWGGHQNLLGDHFCGNLGSHLVSHLAGHFGGHGSSHGDGDGDDHDSVEDTQGSVVSVSSSSSGIGGVDDGGYQVTETVDEDRSGWGGWFNFGNLFGGSSSGSRNSNKVSSRPDRRKYGRYDDQDAPLENKIAPKYDRRNSRRNEADEPLENKIAPNSDRRNYPRNYNSDRRYDQGRNDRFVFEHRSL